MQIKTIFQGFVIALLPCMVVHADLCTPEKHAEGVFFLSSFSINNACQAVAAWGEGPSTGENIFVNNFDGNIWGANPTKLDGLLVDSVSASINNSGNAVVVFGTNNRPIKASTFKNNAWSSVVNVTTNDPVNHGISELGLGLDDNGNAITVWSASGADNGVIKAARSEDIGKTWSDPFPLGQSASNITPFAFSMSCNGNAITMWVDQNGIRAAIFKDNNWEIPGDDFVVTPEAGKSYTDLVVSINDNGNAAAASVVNDQGVFQVQGAFYNGSSWELTNFTSLINPASSFTFSGAPGVSLNNNDRALVGWAIELTSPQGENVLASVQFINGKWEGINSFPIIKSPVNLVWVCNNTAGDGVAALSPSSADGTAEAVAFIGSRSSWSTQSSPLFSGKVGALDCAKSSVSGASAGAISFSFGSEAGVCSVICCNTQFPLTGTSSPTSLAGTCALNRFPTQGELFRKLSWELSPDNDIVSQNIYRDNILITHVPPTQTTFEDHNRPSTPEKYGVSAVSAAAQISVPAEVTPVC